LNVTLRQTLPDVRALLGLTGSLMVLWSIAIGLLTLASDHPLLPATGVGLLTGSVITLLARHGLTRAATVMLCGGLLLSAATGSFLNYGFYGPVWILVPIAVLISGWLLGSKAAIIVAALATADMLFIYGLHRQGHVFTHHVPPSTLLALMLAATWMAAFTGMTLANHSRHQLQLVSSAQSHLAAIFEGTEDLVWSVRHDDFRLLSFNQAFASFVRQQLGIHASPGQPLDDYFQDEQQRQNWRVLYQRALDQGAHTVEYPFAGERTLLLSFNLLREHGQVAGISVLGKEITARKLAEQEVTRKSEALALTQAELERAQAIAQLGSWELDIASDQVKWSTQTYRIFGLAPGTPMSRELFRRQVHPDDLPGVDASWQAAARQERGHEHDFRITVDGRIKWIHNRTEFEYDDSGQLKSMFGILQDITERRLAQQLVLESSERIEFLALHDALTGLPNRVFGQDRLQQAVALANRQHGCLAVLNLDLDKFKLINDTHGHATGDKLLEAVAQRLRACLRETDTLCRLSGDEFMIVLPDLQSQNHASTTCARILSQLGQPFELEGVQLNTSFSIGVALYPQDGADGQALLKNADLALYEAKRAGRNAWRLFEPRMNASLMRYLELRAGLGLALEHQEFELHYQPQLNLDDGRLIGFEALLRWNRPGHGLTMPAEFVSAAEDSGLIVPIGRWVLHEACRQAAAWLAAGGPPLIVSVNLSMVQLRQGRIEHDVGAALAASGLAPALLELELTESVLLQHDDDVMAALQRLGQRGVRLAIDDFGTGYSNLSYLKRFNLDKLKIDRSFVRDLDRDGDDRVIVHAMLQMARNLQIRTIAEGVESAATAARLKDMGCDEVQGYLYGRPMPAPEFERWLAAQA